MEEIIEVLKPGVTVEVGSGITGTICMVGVKESGVQYQVSWWCGRDYKTAWFEDFEITHLASVKTKKIGFY